MPLTLPFAAPTFGQHYVADPVVFAQEDDDDDEDIFASSGVGESDIYAAMANDERGFEDDEPAIAFPMFTNDD